MNAGSTAISAGQHNSGLGLLNDGLQYLSNAVSRGYPANKQLEVI